MTRQGFTAGPKITPPKIIGSECVGVVEDVSPDLKRHADDSIVERRSGPEGAKYKVGDVVIALMGGMGRFFDGCYAGEPTLHLVHSGSNRACHIGRALVRDGLAKAKVERRICQPSC